MRLLLFLIGRDHVSTPTRLIWLSAPATFAHARPGNVYMSTHRTTTFTKLSEAVMRKIGVPVVDGLAVTQSRWDASYDGLHYANRVEGDNWGSQVAMMLYEVVLNVMFQRCGAVEPGAK